MNNIDQNLPGKIVKTGIISSIHDIDFGTLYLDIESDIDDYFKTNQFKYDCESWDIQMCSKNLNVKINESVIIYKEQDSITKKAIIALFMLIRDPGKEYGNKFDFEKEHYRIRKKRLQRDKGKSRNEKRYVNDILSKLRNILRSNNSMCEINIDGDSIKLSRKASS